MCFPKEIKSFFSEVINYIKQELDPDFIIIGGSFGKESWLYNENDLVSDFEFVFVKKTKWSLSKKKKLLKDLNEKYSFEISLKGYLFANVKEKAISNYSNKYQGFLSLDFFDTFSDPKIIYAKENETLDIDCSVKELPVWEAWRLYVNRIGDLLDISNDKNIDKKLQKYYILKMLESSAGSYLIVKKKYKKNITKRFETFNSDLLHDDKELPEACKESLQDIREALRARKEHDLTLFELKRSIKEYHTIALNWLKYFESQLVINEQFKADDIFHFNYLKNKALQKKYLGINSIISNVVSLVYNPSLVGLKFKFFNHSNNWKHLVLLSVSAAFNEYVQDDKNYKITRKVLSKLFFKREIKSLQDNNIVPFTVKYWKKLR